MSKQEFLEQAHQAHNIDTGALWRMISEAKDLDAILAGDESYDTVSNEPGEDQFWKRGSFETFADMVDKLDSETRMYRVTLGGGVFGYHSFEIWVVGGDDADAALETACEYIDALFRDDKNPDVEATANMDGHVEAMTVPRVGT